MSHFQDSEFTCRCGRHICDAPTGPSRTLRLHLDRMRDVLGAPIIITSGNRCTYWNALKGGVVGSEHDRAGGCEGADLACPTSRERWAMLDAARHAGFTRIGIGKDFLHVGVGTGPKDAPNVIWTYYT